MSVVKVIIQQEMLRLLQCLLMMGLIVHFSLAYAEEYVTLPPMIINGANEDLQKSSLGIELLDVADLTRMHYRSLSDSLQGTASYSYRSGGGLGQAGVTLLRGAGGQGIITLDDIPLLQVVPNSHIMDAFPSEAIGQAEIQRGPSAAYYPFQALGGAVRLTTFDQDSNGGKLSVEGGSFGVLRETLRAGLAGKSGRATVTLSRFDAFDGTHFANEFENEENDRFRNSQGILKLAFELSPSTKWEGSFLYGKSTSDIDGFGINQSGLLVSRDDAGSFLSQETWLAQNKLTQQVTKQWQSQLQLGFTQARTALKAGAQLNGVFSRLQLVNWRNQIILLTDPKANRIWSLFWGAQGRYEEGSSPLTQVSAHRTSTAGFAGMTYQNSTLSAEAGVRLESFDRTGMHPLLQASAAWRLSPNLTLRVSGGSGYRLPAFTELLFFFNGNPALKPERSVSGDFGFDWQPVKQAQLRATGFYHHYQDLINLAYNPVPDSTSPSQNNAYVPRPNTGAISANVASARVAGMEISGQYHWDNGMDTGISYTFSDNRDLNTNKLLPFRPRQSLKVWQEWQLSAWPITLRTELFYRNRSWNDFNNQFPVKDSLQLNATLRYRLHPGLDLYLRGENMTDNRHAQAYGFDTPGAAVYGGFTVALN